MVRTASTCFLFSLCSNLMSSRNESFSCSFCRRNSPILTHNVASWAFRVSRSSPITCMLGSTTRASMRSTLTVSESPPTFACRQTCPPSTPNPELLPVEQLVVAQQHLIAESDPCARASVSGPLLVFRLSRRLAHECLAHASCM